MRAVHEARSTKRRRRTKAQVAALAEALLEIVREHHPMTVRQVFYQAVARGLVPKTEAAYRNDVGRLLVRLRRQGRLPYDWIADETRWMRKPKSYPNLRTALTEMQWYYRRDLWAEAPVYVEIWCEKEALAGVLYPVTEEWDVPLMVSRGYASLSYLHAAAESIQAQGKPAYLYYFGDYDPSGKDIPRYVAQTLRHLAPEAAIHFAQVAVTPGQIDAWKLPTRPTKGTDTRARRFGDTRSVELDAIPPERLRELAEACILRHLDEGRLEKLAAIEQAERAILARLARDTA